MPVAPDVRGYPLSPRPSSASPTSRAASTTLANGRPSAGSRSKSTNVGSSGVSARLCQGLNSMHPRLTSRTHRVVDHDVAAELLVGLSAAREVDPPHPPGGVGDRVLEEEVALDAVGVSLEDHRPADEVRHEHRGHAQVVIEEVPLGDPLSRPVRLAEVRQRHGAARPPAPCGCPPATRTARRGRRARVLRHDQAVEDRRAQPPVGGPLGEPHLAGDLRESPPRPGRGRDLVGEGDSGISQARRRSQSRRARASVRPDPRATDTSAPPVRARRRAALQRPPPGAAPSVKPPITTPPPGASSPSASPRSCGPRGRARRAAWP